MDDNATKGVFFFVIQILAVDYLLES
jgi:hypothetical protein